MKIVVFDESTLYALPGFKYHRGTKTWTLQPSILIFRANCTMKIRHAGGAVFTLAALAMLAAMTFTRAGASDEEPFVGSKVCGACHQAHYEAWKNGPHGHSMDSLEGAERTNSQCLACHGNPDSRYDKTVGCESCHGPGRYYSKPYMMRDKPAAEAAGLRVADYGNCTLCHRPEHPMIRSFDAKKDWTKLPHAEVSALRKKGNETDQKKTNKAE